MKTDKDLVLLGSTAPGDSSDPPSTPQGWQPIETAPKNGTEILLTDGHWKRTGYWARRVETWSVDTVVQLKPPTHWMPLPAPPRDEA